MSIRLKMLLPMIIIAVASIAAVLITVSIIFSGYVDGVITDEVNTAGNVLVKEVNDLTSEALTLARNAADSQEIADAVGQEDTAALISLGAEFIEGSGMGVFTVTNEDGIVLARVHDPENFGDTLSQQYILNALQGNEHAGIEEGSAVPLSIRAAMPVYDEGGAIVGTVSLGQNLDDFAFVDELKALVDAEITIFHGDTRLSTSVIDAEGNRAVGTKASDTVIEQVINRGENYSGTAQILGRDAFVKYFPIKNQGGSVIGMLFAGKYSDTKTAAMLSFIAISLLVAALLLAIALPICLYISARTVNPIKRLVAAARQLALGDVDVQLDVHTKDETRALADAFEEMIAGLQHQADILNAMALGDYSVSIEPQSDRDVVGIAIGRILDSNNQLLSDIRTASQHVSAGAGQIANGSQTLATGTTEQAATVEELSATIEQIKDQSIDNTKLADNAVGETREAGQLMDESLGYMEELVGAMKTIATSSDEINKVIKVIDDIAFQTNILALNAAVEAARAGQHGKGFAVVADEVGNLASKSAVAAKETAALIEQSVNEVKQGVGLVDKTNLSLSRVGAIAASNAKSMEAMREASSQQSSAMTEVNQAISNISNVIQANSATSEESAAAAQELNAQSALLNQNIAQFKLRLPGAERRPELHAAEDMLEGEGKY